jgi:hypothetical protein
LDDDIKAAERPLTLEIIPVESIRFRLVMEIPNSTLDPVLEQAYTFDDGPNVKTTKSTDIFGGNAAHPSMKLNPTRITQQFDLATENCKLESIIEQYNESNLQLKTQLTDLKAAGSKTEAMLSTFQTFFEELKNKQFNTFSRETSLDLQATREVFPEVKFVVDKICDAIQSKEENYMKESLREFSELLVLSRIKIRDLEIQNSSMELELFNTKRNLELLEFELKDIMHTVQGICDPEIQNQPVNLYQLKSELRNKLKQVSQQKLDEVAYCS